MFLFSKPTLIPRLKANTSALESHKNSKDLDDEGNESGIDEEDDVDEDSDSDKETKINNKDTTVIHKETKINNKDATEIHKETKIIHKDTEEVAIIQHLFPNLIWLTLERTSGH